MKKNKRVGTLSMAIVLIAFGFLLFIAQFSKISAVDLATKFWPAILILLGVEILWFIYDNKEDENNIILRYDVFSMLIVTVILIVNLGLYGLKETGILDYVKLRVSDENMKYEQMKETNYDSFSILIDNQQ